ncbi:MAG: hypothetical protein AAFW87_07690 [Pseudomonadota bacterium]
MKQSLENAQHAELQDKATDIMLMEDPLAFIAEDHLRVKKVAKTMQRISTRDVQTRKDLFELTSFLENELALLMHDEDDDLIALLQPRVQAEDGFAGLRAQLAEIHSVIEQDRHNILIRLKSSKADGDRLSTTDRALIGQAGMRLLKDMIMENAKLLPLARKRLTVDDIAVLRSRMVQRRISDMRSARDNAR